MKKSRLFVAVFVFFVALMTGISSQTEAGIMGDAIDWQYYVIGYSYNFYGSPGSFVAGSTSSIFGPPYFTISANNTQIIFDYSITSVIGTWSPSGPSYYNSGGLYIDNGILLTDNNANFTSISIDPLTNMGGFSSSNITFNANNIAIAWADLDFNTQTKVVLDVNSNAKVPEPSLFFLFGSGIASLGIFWKFVGNFKKL